MVMDKWWVDGDGWVGGPLVGAVELQRMYRQTQLETSIWFGGISCVATMCSLRWKVPGEVLRGNGRPGFAEGTWG